MGEEREPEALRDARAEARAMGAMSWCHAYILCCGWEWSAIEATDRLGVSETDREALGEAGARELRAYCRGVLRDHTRPVRPAPATQMTTRRTPGRETSGSGYGSGR